MNPKRLYILCLVPGLLLALTLPLHGEEADTSEPTAQTDLPGIGDEEKEVPVNLSTVPAVDLAVRVEMPELEAEAASTEALLREIGALREDFRQLQETLNLLVGQMMADVEAENLQLRNELRRMGASASQSGSRAPVVPGGNQELIDSILDLSDDDWDEQHEPEVDFEFEIIQEWGRSPEAAQALGDNVSTLKGIVGVVPSNSYRDDIEDLGRTLRRQYDAYDNINIEVFDDAEAAQQFAERQVSNPDNRVLSVSKHKDSGRDTILYIEGDKTFDVPLN